VKVIFRSGLSVSLPPHGNSGINAIMSDRVYDFVVRVQTKHSPYVKIDADGLLNGIHSEEHSAELYALATAIGQSERTYVGSCTKFSVDYHLSKDQFLENISTGIYVPEIDLLVVSPDTMDIVHPLSAEGTAIRANESGDLLGFFYRIEIVDPYDQFGSRFINLGGKINRIMPVNDLKRTPGVYVHRVMRSDPAKPADIAPEYFTFEEATKKIKLFHNESEARTLGDLGESQKREYETAIHELKLAALNAESRMKEDSAKYKQAQAEYDARKREVDELKELISTLREERLSKLKEQQAQRAAQREDYYESRSYSRKDDSEWIKWVPAVILGGGLLAYKIFWD
jgi:hypothetical protein